MDITRLTPIEIDTELARLWADENATTEAIARRHASIRDSLHHRGRYGALGAPRDRADLAPWELASVERNEAEIVELTAKLAGIRKETEPFTDEFTRRGGWFRYFLVTNTNGHVHREMNCSTCYPTTRYAWLIDLADCDEAAMIEEWGEKACTVCFPDAPTNPFYNRPARVDREAAEARAKEKAEKLAAKNAKAITDIDGRPLKDSHGYPLKTKIAARNELSGCIYNVAIYGTHPDDFPGTARRMAAALRMFAPEIDVMKVAANAVKRAKKDGFHHIAEAEALVATL